jgi:hypothetical protein
MPSYTHRIVFDETGIVESTARTKFFETPKNSADEDAEDPSKTKTTSTSVGVVSQGISNVGFRRTEVAATVVTLALSTTVNETVRVAEPISSWKL